MSCIQPLQLDPLYLGITLHISRKVISRSYLLHMHDLVFIDLKCMLLTRGYFLLSCNCLGPGRGMFHSGASAITRRWSLRHSWQSEAPSLLTTGLSQTYARLYFYNDGVIWGPWPSCSLCAAVEGVVSMVTVGEKGAGKSHESVFF